MKARYFEGDDGENVREAECPAELLEKAKASRHDLIAALGDFDDVIAERYLEAQEPPIEEMRKAIRKATLSREFVPVVMGSAYKNKGVQTLLDAVTYYLPNPSEKENIALDQNNKEAEIQLTPDANKPFVGLAFKLEDGRYGQLTYIRVYQGKIAKGEVIFNCSAGMKKVKIPRIVRMHAADMNDV